MPATETKYPFDLKPITKIPGTAPHAGFPTGDSAKDFLMDYNHRVKADYGNNPALAVLGYNKKQNVINGSTPFAVVLVNNILRDRGLHVATPADLESVLRAGHPLGLRGHYEDTALVLRSEGNQNSCLAQDLAEQIREQKGGKLDLPVMIPLRYFELEKDRNWLYGLRFKLCDDAKIVYAPILNNPGNFSSVDEKTGLPVETGSEGTRALYTIGHGLSWLRLGRDLDLDADGRDLEDSDSDGRVVVVRDGAEGAAKTLKKKR